jgi:hypothetical protein
VNPIKTLKDNVNQFCIVNAPELIVLSRLLKYALKMCVKQICKRGELYLSLAGSVNADGRKIIEGSVGVVSSLKARA